MSEKNGSADQSGTHVGAQRQVDDIARHGVDFASGSQQHGRRILTPDAASLIRDEQRWRRHTISNSEWCAGGLRVGVCAHVHRPADRNDAHLTRLPRYETL
jgi:hypothetical protein